MPTFVTGIDPKSAEFLASAERNRALVEDLQIRIVRAALGGGETARQKHVSRGKLLPRDRVHGLLDLEEPELIERILSHRRERGEEAAPTASLGARAPPQASLF